MTGSNWDATFDFLEKSLPRVSVLDAYDNYRDLQF